MTMMNMIRYIGLTWSESMSRDKSVMEYSPIKINMTDTGKGNAIKHQVAKMLQSILNLKTLPKNLDSTDGLAAAVCHYYNGDKLETSSNYSGWAAFVKQNPDKVGKK